MFARLTADNRITLPDAVVCDFPDVQVFDVVNEDGRIVLTPVIPSKADAVRAKLAGAWHNRVRCCGRCGVGAE